MEKKRIWLLCLLAYLGIWAGFGLVYWGIAGRDPGSYAYHQEVQLRCKARRFLERTNAAASGDLEEKCGALFRSYDRDIGPLLEWYGEEQGTQIPNFSPWGFGGIGDAWADYYSEKYLTQGNTFFTYTAVKGFSERYTHLQITLYTLAQKPDGGVTREQAGVIGLEIPKDYFSGGGMLSAPAEERRKNLLAGGIYPIPGYLHDLLSLSVVFPDSDILTLYRVDREGCRLGAADFLYFSAVTIATLGYGDISPNCGLVRGLVMLETLLGMTLFALFMSSFYDYLRNREKPLDKQVKMQ